MARPMSRKQQANLIRMKPKPASTRGNGKPAYDRKQLTKEARTYGS